MSMEGVRAQSAVDDVVAEYGLRLVLECLALAASEAKCQDVAQGIAQLSKQLRYTDGLKVQPKALD